MSAAASLISHLEQEIQWMQAINLLLSQEQELLASRQFHILEGILSEKVHLSSQLEESATARIALMDGNNTDPQKALTSFLEKCSAQDAETIRNRNATLADMLIVCRDLNMVNGQVISTCLRNSQIIVNTLTGRSEDALNVYTATGNVQSASHSNRSQKV